jgi:ketosteroid isomerase-like protein
MVAPNEGRGDLARPTPGEADMSSEENVQTAKEGYAAFGRGDVGAILEQLTDDIEWIEPGPADVIAAAGTYRGKEQVAGFFATLGENVEIHKFEPHEFIAQGDHVVVLIHSEATVKRTGRKVTDHLAHVWTFKGGKLARFEVFSDTAAIVAAYS